MIVSFDFDLSLAHNQFVQRLFMSMRNDPKFEPHIVTQRYGPTHPNSEADEVFKLALKLGIPINRIHFTNRSSKWMIIKQLNAVIHVDDDLEQLQLIRVNCPNCLTVSSV